MNMINFFPSKELFLLRGLPGSGKSTKAEQIPGAHIFATDDLLFEDGSYLWTPERSAYFHKVNQQRAAEAMRQGLTPIVIDNPNLQPLVAIPYVRLAKYHNYIYKVIEIETPWCRNPEELVKKNNHGVNLEQIKKGLILLEKWPLPKYQEVLLSEPEGDPEAIISQAHSALASFDYPLVEDLIWSYQDWRNQGGYMPEDGDEQINRIEKKMKPWLDSEADRVYKERYGG